MAILMIAASKATPEEGIAYIMDATKMEICGYRNLDSSGGNADALAEQMQQTQQMWGQCQGYDDRKYYHLKCSFDPRDRAEAGGALTPQLALKFMLQLARENFGDYEAVISIQADGTARHAHMIINAVNEANGKKLDLRNADYRRLKDRIQEMCKEYGLHVINWREATAQKRAQEQQPEQAVTLTFAEKGMRTRDAKGWKDELRVLIDDAVNLAQNMPEFVALLKDKGVVLSRNTAQNISYRYPGQTRAVRGDTLGADYSVAAIRSAISHNNLCTEMPAPLPATGALDGIIAHANSDKDIRIQPLAPELRAAVRGFGRTTNMTREMVDIEIADSAGKRMQYEDYQEFWRIYRQLSAQFWTERAQYADKLRCELADKYDDLRRAREAEWVLSHSVVGVVIHLIRAIIYFGGGGQDQMTLIREINTLKTQRDNLFWQTERYKASKSVAKKVLLQKDLPVDEYFEAFRRLQDTVGALSQGQSRDAILNELGGAVRQEQRLRGWGDCR